MRRLKFTLDRRALEVIYISFIQPLLEYSDVIWDNCALYEKEELDKIQHEAARIVTGATKLISIHALQHEVGWETLSDRRRKHKLVLLFKMKHNLVPSYISSLVPQDVGQSTRYNLRNSDNLLTIPARTTLYSNSFLPSVLREWNSLPSEARTIHTLDSFKTFLNTNKIKIGKLFYYGKRRSQILHTRLRTKCSSLNHHLFLKNIVESPLCRCGSIEDNFHFFFQCHFYDQLRITLLNKLSPICDINLNTLLLGDTNKDFATNTVIFFAVHEYIIGSERF